MEINKKKYSEDELKNIIFKIEGLKSYDFERDNENFLVRGVTLGIREKKDLLNNKNLSKIKQLIEQFGKENIKIILDYNNSLNLDEYASEGKIIGLNEENILVDFYDDERIKIVHEKEKNGEFENIQDISISNMKVVENLIKILPTDCKCQLSINKNGKINIDEILIENVSDLTQYDIVELEKYGKDFKVKIPRQDVIQNKSKSICDEYDLETYKLILDELNKIISGIDENMPEEKKFAIIYERICKTIKYDRAAGYPKSEEEAEYSKKNERNARNLKNGLLEHKCVCAGYAEILRNALSMVGIESKCVSGYIYETEEELLKNKNYEKVEEDGIIKFAPKDKEKYYDKAYYEVPNKKGLFYEETHVWNLVKINGKWYNADATWDREDYVAGLIPTFALRSDEFMENEGKRIRYTYNAIKATDIKYNDKEERKKVLSYEWEANESIIRIMLEEVYKKEEITEEMIKKVLEKCIELRNKGEWENYFEYVNK